jgi:isoleucyl-tRNA synthetase
MELTKEIVKRALELRDNARIPVRQVLNKVTLEGAFLDKNYLEVIKNAVNLKKIVIKKRENAELIVELDTKITPDLKLEGIARNLIRHLNYFRKQLNLSTKNRINLYLESNNKEIMEALEKYKNKIKRNIQADNITQNMEGKTNTKKFKIENQVVEAFIEVIN